MGYDCPCGTSVGTRAHWCEWRQQQHALRVERLLALLVSASLAAQHDSPTSAARSELMALTRERIEDHEA